MTISFTITSTETGNRILAACEDKLGTNAYTPSKTINLVIKQYLRELVESYEAGTQVDTENTTVVNLKNQRDQAMNSMQSYEEQLFEAEEALREAQKTISVPTVDIDPEP